MNRKKLYAVFSFSLLFLWACPEQNNDTSMTTKQINEGEELGSQEISTEDIQTEGLITFCSGEVYLKNADGEQELFIGDTVTVNDSIETSFDSYCEIQFGETAIIRIEEETILALTSVFIGADGSNVDMDLKSGAVLCKVEKLLNKDDSFKVKTDTAVCGVRGTQFSVSKKQNEEMVLAVKEGTVAVVSPGVDELQSKASENKEIVEIVKKLEDTAVLVTANEQIEVKEVDFTESNEKIQAISDLVEEVVVDSDASKIQKLEETISSINEGTKNESDKLDQKKVSLTVEKSDLLKKTDNMKLLNISAKQNIAEQNSENEDQKLYKFSIKTVPEDATIYSGEEIQGHGTYSHILNDKETISLTFKREGYEDFTHEFTINEKTARLHTITLIPIEDYEEQETPEDTMDQVENADNNMDTESVTENMETAENVENMTTEENIPEIISMVVEVTPRDASIIVDGNKAGTGSLKKELTEGESLTIQLKRDGYQTENKTITAAADTASYHFEMIPKPIEKEFTIPEKRGIGKLVTDGKIVFGVNVNGELFGTDTKSGKTWSQETANKPNENSSPVLGADKILLSGVKELISLNKTTGAVLSRKPLSGEQVHLFGRRVLPVGKELLFPGNNSLIKMDSGTLEQTGELKIPGGSRMTPAMWKDKVLIANQKGSLYVMNTNDGSVEKEIQTRSIQPVAVKVNVYNDYAVFCGRKGTLSAINVAKGEILWEKNIRGTVYHDIAMSKDGCFVFVNNSIESYSWKDGTPLFNTIKDVSCAPLINSKNQLIYGSEDNKLIIANAMSGKPLKTLKLNGKLEVTPVEIGGKYIAGKVKNRLLFINPAGIVD